MGKNLLSTWHAQPGIRHIVLCSKMPQTFYVRPMFELTGDWGGVESPTSTFQPSDLSWKMDINWYLHLVDPHLIWRFELCIWPSGAVISDYYCIAGESVTASLECHHETPELCRINTWVVQIQETANESGENRTDLVWIKSQSEEDCSSWSEPVHRSWRHKAGWCRPRSRGFLRRWTEHGSVCSKDRRLFSTNQSAKLLAIRFNFHLASVCELDLWIFKTCMTAHKLSQNSYILSDSYKKNADNCIILLTTFKSLLDLVKNARNCYL